MLINKSEIEELLSKIYVDDNRCIVEKLKAGLRFDEKRKEFKFKEEWRKDDEE